MRDGKGSIINGLNGIIGVQPINVGRVVIGSSIVMATGADAFSHGVSDTAQ